METSHTREQGHTTPLTYEEGLDTGQKCQDNKYCMFDVWVFFNVGHLFKVVREKEIKYSKLVFNEKLSFCVNLN